MPEVIQAKCPHCRKVLRIPAAWIQQSMRCKHCQRVFHVRAKSDVAPAAPLASTPAITAAPFANADTAAPAPITAIPSAVPVLPVARTGIGGWWKAIALATGVVVLAAILGLVVGREIANRFRPDSPEQIKDSDQVAARNDGERPAEPVPEIVGPPVEPEPPKVEPPKAEPPPQEPPKVDPPKQDPPKPEPPPKDPPKKKKPQGKKKLPPKKSAPKESESFPRRALLVSVNDYLFANSLTYGYSAPKGRAPSSTGGLKRILSQAPFFFPESQVYELSDRADSPHPPLKSVLERTISDFLETSRVQDRIVLLFAGHVVEAEEAKEAYLVPLEGDRSNLKTLLPLGWIYDQLKACKARQKILILDVGREDPGRGAERPGSGPMGKILDDRMQKPPAGVQVWSSSSPEQQAIETEFGSLFLQALCASKDRLPKGGIQEIGSAIPVASLVDLVNQELGTALERSRLKLKQVSRLTGSEAPGGAPPNPAEPRPPELVFYLPPQPAGAADRAEVGSILEELMLIPPPRSGRRALTDGRLSVALLPAFPAKELAQYKADQDAGTDFTAMADKYPLRAAVQNSVQALQQNAAKFAMRERFVSGANAKVKDLIRKEQELPARAELYLKEALDALRAAGERRPEESSKRWQAHYDFTLARLLARLVYVKEYNFALAQIRTDNLPEDAGGNAGYVLGSREKVGVNEAEAKAWVKSLKAQWNKIIEDYPNTPWSVLAMRERLMALGLEWRVAIKE